MHVLTSSTNLRSYLKLPRMRLELKLIIYVCFRRDETGHLRVNSRSTGLAISHPSKPTILRIDVIYNSAGR